MSGLAVEADRQEIFTSGHSLWNIFWCFCQRVFEVYGNGLTEGNVNNWHKPPFSNDGKALARTITVEIDIGDIYVRQHCIISFWVLAIKRPWEACFGFHADRTIGDKNLLQTTLTWAESPSEWQLSDFFIVPIPNQVISKTLEGRKNRVTPEHIGWVRISFRFVSSHRL